MKGKVLFGQNLIWVLLLLLMQLHGYKSCIQKERIALLEIKKYMISNIQKDQSDEYVLSSWTSNDTKSDCCGWDEIKCNRTSGRVTEIVFGYLYLKESSLLNLSLLHPFEELRRLDLSDNSFSALFDDMDGYKSLSRLRKLEVLDFSTNEFNDSIYPFLNAATSLTTLFLGFNSMNGPFHVKELKNLTNLELLDLSRNGYNKSIPGLTHLKNLKVLDLSSNDFSSSTEMQLLCEMKNLQEVYLSGNNFVGQLPLCLGSLNKLRVLDLSLTQLSRSLPSTSFSSLESLEYLSLADNNFEGLFSFSPLANLTKLKSNKFTREIRVGLVTLVNLSVLDASNNRLTGAIPSWIPESSHLIMLLLSNNLLEGTLPPSLLAIYHLNFLDLSGNLLSGELPFSYVNSMYGINIFLNNNNITGPIPVTLLDNAKILDLRNNKLSGNISHFTNTGDMRILLLRGNNLTGSIPRKICELRSIKLLDLSDNKFHGTIPSCLYNLSFGLWEDEDSTSSSGAFGFVPSLVLEFYRTTFLVDEFMFDYNTYMSVEIQFSTKERYDSYIGASKFSQGTLDYMYGLDLSSNELIGVIPTELGDLLKLRAMNLSRNFLSSSIPDSLSKLKDLESLDLSYNMLHGRIPNQLTNLSSLAIFNVSYNNLSGIIPQGKQFSTFSEISYLGNPLLCGQPTNRSCEANSREEEEEEEGEYDDDDDDDIDMMVFYWTSALTYGTALIGILVLMCFDCPWRRGWLRLIDAFIDYAKNVLS
ncbi:unnamed protein product [Cochlearia groenlandica]